MIGRGLLAVVAAAGRHSYIGRRRRVVLRMDRPMVDRLDALRPHFGHVSRSTLARAFFAIGVNLAEAQLAGVEPPTYDAIPEAPPPPPEPEPVASDPFTMRARILATMTANPGEVYGPARLAPILGSPNRDSIRNTLLALARKGLIVKVDLGQYRARTKDGAS